METLRRVRAARGSLNYSLDEFADAIGIGRQTLIRIENGTRQPKPHEYEAMARASGLPLEFFTAPDLHAALDGVAGDPALGERVDELEVGQAAVREQLTKLAVAVTRLSADSLRHTREIQELRDTGRSPAHNRDSAR